VLSGLQRTLSTTGSLEKVAELAGKEVPNKLLSESSSNDSVFFLQGWRRWFAATVGWRRRWEPTLKAIQAVKIVSDHPTDLHVQGFGVPFRVASIRWMMEVISILDFPSGMNCGVLRSLRLRFFLLWL